MTKKKQIPNRILMGPGPSDVAPSVLGAMSQPILGHLDPAFIEIMNDNVRQLRVVFGTENELTLPMSGTGSAGMETSLVNIIEPGDTVAIAVNGVFGQRMSEVAKRCGAEVIDITADWGAPIDSEQVEKVFARHKSIKALGIVHAETSTGVRQPLGEIAKIVHSHDSLLIVDAVTSLGGIPVEVDEIGIDVCYSGTQKCLSVPPGLSPVTFNERAMELVRSRRTAVQSWYLDLNLIQGYWGGERLYHHTAPISMNYALREALSNILDEGLENVYHRHQIMGSALRSGLEAMGLKLLVEPSYRLPQLTTVFIPDGVNDLTTRASLLELFGIEIGGGLGPLKGKIWRIGLMGHSCTKKNTILFLAALEHLLNRQGVTVPSGVAAAMSRFE